MKRWVAVAVAVFVGMTAGIQAVHASESAEKSSEEPDTREIRGEIRRELETTHIRRPWFLGARVSHPQKVSASIGWIFSRQPTAYRCGTVCDYQGWTVSLEPGLGGGKVSGGYGRIFSVESLEGNRLRRIYMAGAGRLALLRTWGDANLEPIARTFVGFEGSIAVTQVQLNVGVFRRVSSGDPQEDWLVSVGLGYGF